MSQSDYDPRAMDVAGELADTPLDQRQQRLHELCGMDEALRARVLSLLQELTQSPRTRPTKLTSSSPALTSANLTPSWFVDTSDRPAPVERIGPYKLLKRIGVGGMSEVYEAEQERPRRRVALKLIHPLRMSDAMLRRFEFEVEVLGRLEHPGIARVYDAGTAQTSFGPQPYFAMELVRGHRLNHWVRMKRPDLRRRLGMLIDICEAVQHAHEHGVIHRDLKPSNILVTEDGDEPKVLDFGVAAAVEGGAGAGADGAPSETLHTATGQIVGTLQYMSPEQAAGDARGLDTRSDVYALGVIAYQMLSDRLPYEVADMTLPDAVSVILNKEPTRLSTIDRGLGGDLETIVLKALSKEKQRRYAGCSELAADVRRYLNYEPISARPPSPWYQASKFARRHKTLVGAAALAALALVVGTTVATVAMFDARRAQRDAESARAVAEETNAFLKDMLASVDPEKAQGREVTVREVLEGAGAQIAGRFASQPVVEAELRGTIGRTFHSLGLYAPAREQLTRAADLLRGALGEDHPRTLDARDALALVLDALGETAAAEAAHRGLLAASRRVLGADHPSTLSSLNNLACNLDDQARWDEAQALHREALERRRRTLGDAHAHTLQSMHNLGTSLMLCGRATDALPLLREVTRRRQDALGGDHPSTLASVNVLAKVLLDAGDAGAAEPLLRDASARCERVFGPDHNHTLATTIKWAAALRESGRADEAERVCSRAVERGRAKLGEDHPTTLQMLNEHATTLARLGRTEESERLQRDLIPRIERAFGPAHPGNLIVRGNLALLLLSTNREAEAESLLRDVLARREAAALPPTYAARFAHGYARSLQHRGALVEAKEALLKAREHLIIAASTDGSMKEVLDDLVQVCTELNLADEAERWHRERSGSDD